MTATFSLRPPPPFLRYLLETRKPRKSALGRDRGADCRWMGGRRRLKPVLTTHKWMRLATFRARVTTDVTTGKSIYCASSVCSVPHLTFHICVHSKSTGERVQPEATAVCLVCRLGLSKLALICLFPPLCSVFRVHTCLPHLARGPLLPLPLSPSRRLFLRASLISCPLCLRPVSTLGSMDGLAISHRLWVGNS